MYWVRNKIYIISVLSINSQLKRHKTTDTPMPNCNQETFHELASSIQLLTTPK